MIDARQFQELRPYLFSIAYRMLGRASEAEDVIQDAWLRAQQSADAPDSTRAWLSTVVTRLCLDRLKSAQATREEYVGPWLPEPVLPDAFAPDATVLQDESITLAFLVLLERLSPAERAAFLLREVFDYEYRDVAGILDVNEAATRQLVHRARERLAQGRKRFEPDPERRREVVHRFLAAAREGDLAGLEELLAADAHWVADGGGKVPAATRVVQGASPVARFFLGIWTKGAAVPDRWRVELREINGEPALLAFVDGGLDTVFVFSIGDERIQSVQAVRNPEKLAWLRGRLAPTPEG